MTKKIIILCLGSLLTFTMFGSCSHKSEAYEYMETSYKPDLDKNTETSYKLELNKDVLISSAYDDVTVKLGENLERFDEFDARQLLNPNYTDINLKIKFDSDNEIVNAQYIENYYPTIWNEDEEDNLIQYVYLYNLGKAIKQNPQIKDGNTIYIIRDTMPSKEIERGLANISKDMVLSSIDSIPTNYQEKEDTGYYEYQNWNEEVKKWKKIASRYKPGDFKFSSGFFDISPYETYLILTIKGKDGDISTKIFKDFAIVGN